MFNKKHLILSLLSASVLSSAVYAAEYTGTVAPLKVIQHGAGTNAYFYGYLKYAARLGEIALPSETNSKGETVVKGTVLFSMDREYWAQQLKGAQDQEAAAKVALDEASVNLKRYQELIKTNATSQEIYEGYLGQVASSYNTWAQAKGNVVQFQEFLKLTDFVSPFEGIITRVMYSQGVTAENEAVFELTQLNPIGIDIPMSREEAGLFFRLLSRRYEKASLIITSNKNEWLCIIYLNSLRYYNFWFLFFRQYCQGWANTFHYLYTSGPRCLYCWTTYW